MDKFKFKDKIHFGVLSTPVREMELKLDAYLHQIVLKRPNGTVISNGFTCLEQYARAYNGHTLLFGLSTPPAEYKLLYICKCLNYLLYHEGIRRLSDTTPEMLYRCFDEYRLTEKEPGSEEYVNQDTLNKFVKTICEFFANVALVNAGMKFTPQDLLISRKYTSARNPYGKATDVFFPLYNKKAIPCARKTLIREIPEEVFAMLMEEIRKHDPMIYFAVILQAYAGLRASECMNLRRENSPLSTTPGVDIRYLGNSVSEMYFDLTREFRMRSDGVDVGKIKRNTDKLTQVYPKNLQIVVDAYNEHLKLLSTYKYEADIAPMFVISTGMAMTTDTYQYRFNNVVKNHLRKRLMESADSRLVLFGQELFTNNFPTHGLRHYFSVHLALDGLDAAQIMAYRGDRNINSATVYLANKGILEERLRMSHSIALETMFKEGGFKWSP